MKVKDAKALTGGGLGSPSKMPGTSYGISAHNCITGAKLAKIEGSVCHGCYALRANYNYQSVKTAHQRRQESIAGPHWSAAMAFLINKAYGAACQEYMDLIKKHAQAAFAIERSLLKRIGCPNRTRVAGYGLAQCTQTDMDTIAKHAELNPAMYPLTLPHSGAIVDLSPMVSNCTTDAETAAVLIRTICDYLRSPITDVYTQMSDVIPLPDGLQLTFFQRFHDSGDLQSVEHLTKICAVAALTPTVNHWLPTREHGIVQAYKAQGGIVPDNLLIRVSATMIDGPATKAWPYTSGVHTQAQEGLRVCPAPTTNNTCGPCRACWSKDVPHVSYHKH